MDLVTISDHRRRKSSSLLTRDSSHFLLISVALIGAVFLIYTNMKKSSFSESDVGFRRNNHHNNKIKVANRIHESEKKRSRPESDDSDNNKREKIHDEMKNNPHDSVEENSVNNKHYEAREVETEFQDTKDKRQKPGREEEKSHEEYNDVDKEAPKKHERVYQDTRDDGADPKSHDENSEGEKHYDEEFEKNFTPDYDDDNKNELSHKQMNEVQRNADQDSQRFGEESFKRERKDFRHKSAKGRDDDEDLENDNDREEDSNFQKLNNDAKHPSDEQEDDETKEENKSINSMKKQPSEDKIVPDKTNSENVAQEIPESGKQEKAGRVSQADDEENTHDLPEEKPRFGKVSDDEGKREFKKQKKASDNGSKPKTAEDTREKMEHVSQDNVYAPAVNNPSLENQEPEKDDKTNSESQNQKNSNPDSQEMAALKIKQADAAESQNTGGEAGIKEKLIAGAHKSLRKIEQHLAKNVDNLEPIEKQNDEHGIQRKADQEKLKPEPRNENEIHEKVKNPASDEALEILDKKAGENQERNL